MWAVVYHPEAEDELGSIPVVRERTAITHVVEKLAALGPRLPFPHQSHVEGPIRELRPRAGRSPWRAFYGQIGDTFVIASIGSEAAVNRRAFARAVEAAVARLNDIES
ncbi:MAG: type II toxin-antitoxin system RelE/ParE family toxin [Acidimicrobiia bacterium]